MGFPIALFVAAVVNMRRSAAEDDARSAKRDAERSAARDDDLSPRTQDVVDRIGRSWRRDSAAYALARTQEKPDLGLLCEALGIKLREEAMPESVCGRIEIRRVSYEHLYDIVVNAAHTETRRRFTIAHMLGHKYYHGDMFDHRAKRGANADTSYNQVPGEPWYNPTMDAECKSRANRFAVGLLMPHARMVRLIREGLDAEAIAKRLCITVRTAELRIEGVRGAERELAAARAATAEETAA